MTQESELEGLLELAYRHTISEYGFENVKPSFALETERLHKAHDAVHEFMLLAPLLVPSQVGDGTEWQRKSAFFIYQWEAFHHAHRSLGEALCAYYNVAFILLRATFELLIKGAFWECLSHREFRENSQVLDRDRDGARIKKWLNDIFQQAPDVEGDLERISVGIYDKIEPMMESPRFRLQIKAIVQQLESWDIFNPVPNAEVQIYDEIYRRLSSDVHVIPDKIDIGKRLAIEQLEIFKQQLLPDALCEFAILLHRIMDLAIVIELNILGDYIGQYDEVKVNLDKRLGIFEQLGLKYALERASRLLEPNGRGSGWAVNSDG
jgi:hypothetical protein